MGRTFIGIYSIFGILISVAGVISVVLGLAISSGSSEGVTQIIEWAQSVFWVVFALPLAFMISHDVRVWNQQYPEADKKSLREPIVWIILAAVAGPLAGIVYWFFTKDREELQVSEKKDNLSKYLSFLTPILAILAGMFKLWSIYSIYMTLLIVTLIVYIVINIVIIYKIRSSKNYDGLPLIVFSLILLIVLLIVL